MRGRDKAEGGEKERRQDMAGNKGSEEKEEAE